MKPEDLTTTSKAQIQRRRKTDSVLHIVFLACTSIGMITLIALIIQIIVNSSDYITSTLFTNYPSRNPEVAGMKSALVGTFYMMGLMAPLSFIVGVGAAIYLEEYAKKNRWTLLIQLNISTLAGVPSIVYGMLGLTIFVRVMHLERSLIAGVFTMTLLVLPVIIVAAQEAIKAVPRSRRDASFALGATKWQTVQNAVLPSAIPGILTGIILALSRAIGETAPLIMIGALTYVAFLPANLLDQFTVIPIQIFNWVSRPQAEFQDLSAAAILVLLAILFLMNISAVIIRNKYQHKA
jgi:phosphate transport system permease protein